MEFILGSLSILLGILAILFSYNLSKRTDRVVEAVSNSTNALIQSEDKRVKELIAKMDERGRRQDEILEKMDERTERQSQILEKIVETQRYVAELVKSEGEKTRTHIGH